MRQVVEITPLNLRRLRNYGQVARNRTRLAHKKQWMTMTLESMQDYQACLKESDHAAAVVGYASLLFRMQHGKTPPRTFYGEHFLVNALVRVFDELHIPVVMVRIDEETSGAFHC